MENPKQNEAAVKKSTEDNKSERTLKYLVEKVFVTWQFIVLLVLIIFSGHVGTFIDHLGKFKVGNVEFTISELAKNAGIPEKSIKQLKGLSYDELKLFLIKGGEDGDATDYNLKNYSDNYFIKMHKDLDSLGLIRNVKIDSNHNGNKGELWVNSSTTPIGRKLHRAILDAIYNDFTKARIEEKADSTKNNP